MKPRIPSSKPSPIRRATTAPITPARSPPTTTVQPLSQSALQNNIGVLLHRRGSVGEATERFLASIAASKNDEPKQRSHHPGLAWFHRKLLAEEQHENDGGSSSSSGHGGGLGVSSSQLFLSARQLSPESGGGGRKRSNSIVAPKPERQWQSDDGRTPLGLEFVSNPTTTDVETVVGAAARLNLACVKFESSNGEDQLQEVLNLLVEAAELASVEKEGGLIEATARSNAGVILFKQGKTSDAMEWFQKAKEALDKAEEFRIKSTPWNKNSTDAPLRQYLLVAILLNTARTAVRLGDADQASELCHTISSHVDEIVHHPSTNSYHLPPVHCHFRSRSRWVSTTATHYVNAVIHHRRNDLPSALRSYASFLSAARHHWGHTHPHIATILFHKGLLLFEQRKLHHAMLAYLASLRIHESHSFESKSQREELARVLYGAARTLHDREEFGDALNLYRRTLTVQKSISGPRAQLDVITTLCNLSRVHHIIGQVDEALTVNDEIIVLAKMTTGGRDDHPFVVDRIKIKGNLLVVAGRTGEAMEAFAMAARASPSADAIAVVADPVNCFDVDGRSAESLAKLGLQHPSSAAA